jgi:exopolysaccharide production protein ExoZ
MIRSLQAFRAVAALLVMVQHLNITLIKYFNGTVANETLMPLGYAGVQFFFVLSGFIIYHAHRAEALDRSRLPHYLGKRAWRVLPLYWLVTLALLPAYFLIPSFGDDYHRNITALISSLLLVPQSHDPHLTVGWTLIHEGLFYLFFSLFFLTRHFRLLSLAWAVAIGIHLFAPGGSWLINFLFSAHNLLFLAGIMIAANRDWIETHLSGRVLFSLGIVGACFGLASALSGSSEIYSTLSFGAVALLLVMASAGGGIETLFVHQRVLVFLGAASYAIYLIHFPLMIALSKVLAALDQRVNLPLSFVIALLFGSSLGAGILLHLWVERPLLARTTGLLRPKQKLVAPTSIARA